MAKRHERLKARQVETAKPGTYPDGGNLYLVVQDSGARSWVFRWKAAGKVYQRGLGPTHAVGLANARQTAQALRQGITEGKSPDSVLEALRPRPASTFKDAAEQCIETKRPEWRNEKHASQWTSTLEQYAYPEVGHLPPAAVELSHVLAILKPIWSTKTETATRVRQRIEQVLDWASVHGLRDREKVNPARWRGNLDKVLPKPTKVKKVTHHPALPYAQVPAVLEGLKARRGPAALALRFLILTAARSGEVRGMTWDEVKSDVWTVPGGRMKAGREHRIPLSQAALDVLKEAKTINAEGFVFAGLRKQKALSDVALSKALPDLADGSTVHGFRSSFRDWASEQTSFPRDVIELALAHVNKDRVEAAYLRSDLFEKRLKLMQAWAKHCLGGGNIVALAARRKGS